MGHPRCQSPLIADPIGSATLKAVEFEASHECLLLAFETGRLIDNGPKRVTGRRILAVVMGKHGFWVLKVIPPPSSRHPADHDGLLRLLTVAPTGG